MRVLIRCDAGPGIGVGHAVRSLALAEEATSRGHEVRLAGALAGGFVEGLVEEVGVGVVPGSPVEAGAVAELAAGHDILHVDHYGVSPDLLAALRARGVAGAGRPRLSTMADGAFGARDTDLAVDCTPGRPTRDPGYAADWLLRGPRFTPLRSRVRSLRADSSRPVREVLRVLVVMGGADPQGLGPSIAAALDRTGTRLDATVVAAEHTRAGLEAQARTWGSGSLTVRDVTPDLPDLMAQADLVVSAAGTSTWELAAMGTPMALVASVDNQRLGYDAMVDAGAGLGLGDPDDVRDVDRTARALGQVLRDAEARRRLATRAARIVDGLGAWRVVSAWEALVAGARPGPTSDDLAVREVSLADAALLHSWRNDPTTREQSRNSDPVPWADHLAWLRASLGREDRLLLIAEDGRPEQPRPVGTVRWDRVAPGEWEVSVTVAPERRGEGLAAPLLHSGERLLASRTALPTGLAAYLAVVHEGNGPSLRLFLGSGYLPDLPADGEGFRRFYKAAVG